MMLNILTLSQHFNLYMANHQTFPSAEYTTSEESDVPPRSASTWLIYKAKRANYRDFAKYISEGADVNYQIRPGETALYLIAKNEEGKDEDACEAVKKLLQSGADITIGWLLSAAIMHYKRRTFKVLLEAGADVNVAHPNHGTPLFFAGSMGIDEIMKMVIERNPKINISNLKPTNYSLHPDDTLDYSLMFMFASGEKHRFFNTKDMHLPYAIIEEQRDMTLKNLCRRAIRAYATSVTHENLFEVSSKLELPKILQSYLVFDLRVTMTVENFYKIYPDANEVHPDADAECVSDIDNLWHLNYTDNTTDQSEYPDSVYSYDHMWIDYREKRRQVKRKKRAEIKKEETDEEEDDKEEDEDKEEQQKEEDKVNEGGDKTDDVENAANDEAENEADDEADDETDDELMMD